MNTDVVEPGTRSTSGPSFRSLCRRIYHWMLTLPGGGRGVPRRLPDGGTAYVLPWCRYVDWSRPEYRLFREALRPGGVVLDIGANVGFHALFFCDQVAPGGKVYAFEPALQSFDALSQHVAMNGRTGSIQPVHAAVGDRPGTLSFVADGVQGSNHVAPDGAPSAATVTVPCVTVDGFCEERGIRPTVMKIDTEGFALQVLRGARKTIEAAGPVLVLFIELHPTFWRRAGYGRAELQSGLGFARTRPARGAAQDGYLVRGQQGRRRVPAAMTLTPPNLMPR